MKYILIICLCICSLSCKNTSHTTLQPGSYRGVLDVTASKPLPFIFEVKNDSLLHIYNAEEQIVVNNINYKNDSVYINLPVYEAQLVAKIKNNTLNGIFIKPSLQRIVPFYAEKETERFINVVNSKKNVSGVWETHFSPNSKTDHYIAQGLFKQQGNQVTGTFKTTTGDYRYLEGVVSNNTLKLSTFDGAHAFLFEAEIKNDTLIGTFYSGNHYKEPFIATLNPDFKLPEASTLTYLNEGYNSIAFSFPDATGKLISLTDSRFKNKVVVVQIMGTWCPNCLDESRYFSSYYNSKSSKNLEFVALAFEYVKTKEKAFSNIKRLKENVGINYPILLAQYGSSSKVKAQEKLPMLNHVLSYPTSIFIDKKGVVRKIHTGFNGPATGKAYDEFKKEFDTFITDLLAE